MANENNGAPFAHNLKHIRVEDFRSETSYSPPSRDMSGVSSGRNRAIHGPKLENELASAFARANELLTARDPEILSGDGGVYVAVESAEDKKLPDLSWSSKGIRLGALSVTETGSESGTLFVPASAESFLTEKVREYSQESTAKNEPRHEDKFAPVETFSAGSLESLWTDQRPLPTDLNEMLWWECWCWKDRAASLPIVAQRLELRVSERRLHFPEFDVIPVFANRQEIERLLQNTDAIEEFRRASDNPSFFTSDVRFEQDIWIDDLVARISPPSENAPAVCILDGGINRAHPLLEMALDEDDCLTVNTDWGTDDHDDRGHGTGMAGVVLYDDLTYPLSDDGAVELDLKLESAKFLPPPAFEPTDPMNYGSITQAAISLPEIENPERPRVFCMAVTNRDVSGERPTSWSGALDQACAGVMPGDEVDEFGEPPRRLFFVSAGNVPDSSDPDEISDPDEFPVEDPAQAWNAIAVGGFTDKVDIAPADGLDGWSAAAEVGDRSPYSRISTDWSHSRTPIKPEIVFEAGNRALSPEATELLAGVDSLSLLTTNNEFIEQPLTTFWATSPATAQAAGMAASIMARQPDLWPETIRALMVHSAEWTPAMLARLKVCKKKADAIELARHFGYGVPHLERALSSAENDLAFIAQTQIKPFKRERKPNKAGKLILGEPSFDEVHYYELPWPRQALEELGEEDVRFKIALSYFIEPSPGETAPVTPARYQSFGLRYELKRPTDTADIFRQRVNRLEKGGEKLPPAETDARWTFGSQSISAGSLHCDVWVGPAAELAARGLIAVYPVGGWWRYQKHLERYNSRGRYALVASITSEDQEVELYTEVANLIGLEIATEIET